MKLNISKEKQMHLVGLAVVTVAALGALWSFLISAQQAHLVNIDRQCNTIKAEKAKEHKVILTDPALTADLLVAKDKLKVIETGMPSGDLYSWIVSAVKQFNSPIYHVTLNQFGTPEPSEMNLIPNFPYTQVSMNLTGSAYYNDLGNFISELENQFPYFRIERLTMDPYSSANPQENEKIFFRMSLVCLVKPSAPLMAASH